MVKVAVIGPQEIVQRVMDEGGQLAELEFHPVPYVREADSLENSLLIDHQVDVILYTGPVPYTIAKKNARSLKSALMYINYGGTGLYRVLFQMVKDGFIQQGTANRISIDFLNSEEVIGTFEELEIDYRQLEILELKEFVSSDEIVERHLQLWKNGKIDSVITCIVSVYKKLKELEVPVYCIMPTRTSIMASLRLALVNGKYKTSENNQIAACQFSLEATGNREQLLRFMSDALQTSMQQVAENIYLVFTTKGLVLSLTEGLKKLPGFMKKEHKIHMGIGIGITAKEAVLRSYMAYQKSEDEGDNVLYVIGDENSVIRIAGLEEHAERMEYQSRTYDEIIRNIASETKLSISTLSKIKYVSEALGKYDVTALELGKQLNITLRSARRILKALADEGYAQVIGGEQPILRGRPRQIYKLLI
ncbi:hypothetical protein [Ferviditalea candida]|uniref:Transcriptional regulator n=1 Tax=Ferviditalea candida TaxID=3108399 RepID=A0ABU5ZE86_9BACL|nr:hypothetical protein [Paenibacillaceae bacterium T2]